MRLIRLNTVVLPAPLGPIRVNTSPCFTSKLTLLTASTPPKRTLRLLAERRVSVIKRGLERRRAAPRRERPLRGAATRGSGGAWGRRSSFQPVRFLERFLPLEHALAVERKHL